jgi:hypothetical protein
MDPLALFSILYEPGLFQGAEMERYLRLDHIQSSSDIADAQFALFKELDDPEPGLIGQSFKYGY